MVAAAADADVVVVVLKFVEVIEVAGVLKAVRLLVSV